MKRLTGIVLSVVVVALGAAPAALGGSDEDEFEAILSGDNEVPPVKSAAGGRARIEFNNDATVAQFELRVRKGVRVTQAHIHCAGPEDNGPVVAFLAGFHQPGWDVNGQFVDDARLTDANIIPSDPGMNPTCPVVIQSLADLAFALSEGYGYVNVHTAANPAGEVRGQFEGS